MSETLWVVRAGRGAQHAEEFLAEGHVAVGFREVATDDASTVDEASLRQRGHDGATRSAASQLVAFTHRMQAGDLVITPRLPAEPDYLVGRVGAYEHHADDPASGPHRRAVTWLGRFLRADLDEPARRSLGAIQTIFRPTAVEAELRNLITSLLPLDAAPPRPASRAETPDAPLDVTSRPVHTTAEAHPPSRRPFASAQVDVTLDPLGRAVLVCDHPALVMEQTPRDVDPGGDWEGVPGVYVLTGTDLEHSSSRTGRERTLTTTLIVRPWAYVGLSEDFRGRIGSHRQAKPEWRRALLVRSGATPFTSDDIKYLELAVHRALEDTGEVTLAQSTPRGNLSARPRRTDLLDACAETVVAVLRLTGTLI